MKPVFNPEMFARVVRNKLVRKGLSARDAAKLIGLSHATISRVCKGGQPDLETYLKIVRWLDK